ncbi:IS66 family transposase [Paraburkholderia domus]|uniref:IS66 family transposase n=1 Tax=Paraburkholderia domus TaxID=2793075 RepID=UPI001914BA74|nr:IS66 family transposase [Paraburkholderia domus]MBK5125906.1 IS66 family transposase [Burkholderia sp. R-69980]MBK5186552.1 IS66 family transposase [Burkholderia sp. R-69749]MCI0152469.1 IS66 family transposase [Paraburkholderia sediminicola]CAE6907781.1 IS66 family transposase ISMma14 [Paraburkholderia domus]
MPDIKDLTPEQKDALIVDLVRRLNELEAKLEKDSHNSSKPPSSDGPRRKPKSLRGTSGAKPGAQPGHKGKTLTRVAQPDHIKIHPVAPVCDACGQQIESTRITVLPEGRQVIDLPPTRFEVTEHRVQVAQCACGKRHSGVFPESVSQAVQYGPQIRAAAVYLTQYQQLPVARTVQALGDLFGLRVSTGTVQQSIDEAARLLAPAVKQISDALREQPVVHFDESSMRVGRTPHWLHVASTRALSWYGAHSKRGSEALDSFGILPGFKGVAVHDGWRPYASYECEHALCNAHHLRELVFVAESTQQPWAQQMIDLLCQAKREVDLSVASGNLSLGQSRQRYYRRRSRALIAEARKLNPTQARAPTRVELRGRIRQSFTYNLVRRLQLQASEVWRFIADHRVPFDNNQAERDIRMPKLKQKISGCFRAVSGMEAFCTIRSYLGTLRKQNRSLIDALALSFAGLVVSPLPAAG